MQSNGTQKVEAKVAFTFDLEKPSHRVLSWLIYVTAQSDIPNHIQVSRDTTDKWFEEMYNADLGSKPCSKGYNFYQTSCYLVIERTCALTIMLRKAVLACHLDVKNAYIAVEAIWGRLVETASCEEYVPQVTLLTNDACLFVIMQHIDWNMYWYYGPDGVKRFRYEMIASTFNVPPIHAQVELYLYHFVPEGAMCTVPEIVPATDDDELPF